MLQRNNENIYMYKKSKQNMYNIYRKIFKFLNLFVSLKIIVEMQKCNTKYFVCTQERFNT